MKLYPTRNLTVMSLLVWPALAQAAANELPPLIPAYGALPATFWEQHRAIILIAGIGLIVLAGIWGWALFRPKPAPILPPEKIARIALEQLRSRAEDGKLLSEVSQILRRFVGATLHFPGGEMTTTEFSAALAGSPHIDPQLAAALSSFLLDCDKHKFTAQKETPPLNAVQRAFQLIDLAERDQIQLKAASMSTP